MTPASNSKLTMSTPTSKIEGHLYISRPRLSAKSAQPLHDAGEDYESIKKTKRSKQKRKSDSTFMSKMKQSQQALESS